jgi:xanthine/CO dehydrogenase XdhC/CoxF family maturation factor
MTHSYEQDREILASLLPAAPGYLGLLGARHRSSLLVSEAAVMIGWSVAECCELIHAPVGLDLGGDGPEAIALAVIAEVQAFCQGKVGVSRKLTPESIAEQIERGGASRYLQVQCAMDEAQ